MKGALRMKLKQWISCILLIAVLLTALPSGALAADRAGTGEPELQDLTVETASGQTISLLDEPGAIDLEGRYSFTAVFSHPEQVERVYITSTKGGAVRLLEAQWDEHDRAFTTSGFFNGDEDYIPGQIGVEYTIKTQAVDIEGAVDWNALQSGLGGQVSAEAGGSAAPGQYTVDLTSLLAAESKVAVNVAVDVFDADTGGNLNDWLGTYQDYETLASYVVEGGSKYIVYLDYSDPSTYAMILKDASGSTFVKMIVGEAGELFGSQTLKRIAEQLDNVSSVSSMAHQLLTVHDSVSELRSQVSGRTDLTGSEKEELNQRIDDYENDRLLFFLTMTALPAVVAASGGTMAGPALVFNALLGVLNAAAGTFWDYRVGMMTGCEPLDTDFTGDAHGVLLTSDLLEEMDNTITESGTYYLDGDTTLEIGAVGGPAVNVVLCKHGYNCNVQVHS